MRMDAQAVRKKICCIPMEVANCFGFSEELLQKLKFLLSCCVSSRSYSFFTVHCSKSAGKYICESNISPDASFRAYPNLIQKQLGFQAVGIAVAWIGK